MIRANIHADDHRYAANFDATAFFWRATDEEIVALANCGWGGDYPADDVALFFEERDRGVTTVFDYTGATRQGFECHVDEDDAMAWLHEHRPELARKIEEVA